jgi:hypothetical protein
MLPYGITYFCDDIRFEQQNKFSLIGCYGSDIILSQVPPIALPKFCIITQIRFSAELRSAGKLMVYMPDDQLVTVAEWPDEEHYTSSLPVQNEKSDLQSQRAFLFPMIFSPFPISKDGHIRVRMEYRGEIIRLGALHVVINPSTASPQPSEQSRPDVPTSS